MPEILRYAFYEDGTLTYNEEEPTEQDWDPNDLTYHLDEQEIMIDFLNKHHKNILKEFNKYCSDFKTVGRVRGKMMKGARDEEEQ